MFTLDVGAWFLKRDQATLSVASVVDAKASLSDVAVLRLTRDRYV